MDTIYKIIEDCAVKKIGERQYEFTASTSIQDRDGEVIDSTGWDLKNFKKNPVIMYAHNYNSLPIGKAPRVWVSKDGTLKNTVEFPPEGTYEFADIVERLVDNGYLKTESVGFIPKQWIDGDGEKSPRRTYTKQELLEISIVPVPSNPDALRNAVNDGVITTKQFEAITDKVDSEGEPEIVEAVIISEEIGGLSPTAASDDSNYTYGMIPQPKGVSQEAITDELDYIIRLIKSEGMNEGVEESAWNLVREILRLHGGDIPSDIKDLVSQCIEETEDTITYSEIQEAIKRIANKQEVY